MPRVPADRTVDCRGLCCPMPIVRTAQAMDALPGGQVLEVLTTDQAAVTELRVWAQERSHQYLGHVVDDGVIRHYIRKARGQESPPPYPDCVPLTALLAPLEDAVLLDVREPAEYAFAYIPGSVNIPLGQLQDRWEELPRDRDIYVICRTGTRSCLACHLLRERGLHRVWNVIPGIAAWEGQLAALV